MQTQWSATEGSYRPGRRFALTNVGSPDKLIELEAGQGWAIKGRRRRQIVLCLSGRVWITQEGDIADYVLEAGDAFLVTRPGLVLVRALNPARIGCCEGADAASGRGRGRQTRLN